MSEHPGFIWYQADLPNDADKRIETYPQKIRDEIERVNPTLKQFEFLYIPVHRD